MNQEKLKDLIEVHNLLYRIPVAGACVVPMAQALATLQNIISDVEKTCVDTSGVAAGGEQE